jgi:hypothetical protein
LVGSLALVFTDYFTRPERSRIDDSIDAGTLVGLIVISGLVGSLQLFLGVPSLLILEARKSGKGGYLITGVLVAVILSFGISQTLMAPQFGETMSWLYPRVFAFWGVPVILGYWLAFRLRAMAAS